MPFGKVEKAKKNKKRQIIGKKREYQKQFHKWMENKNIIEAFSIFPIGNGYNERVIWKEKWRTEVLHSDGKYLITSFELKFNTNTRTDAIQCSWNE